MNRPATSISRGVLFVGVATVLFVTMNSFVKLLSRDLPPVELIWARTLGHLIFVLALFGPAHGGWRLLLTRRPALQAGRSLLLLAATSFFFTAIGRVPLADATAVSFSSPFVVAALAGPMLRERVWPGQWVAIAVGFVGALIIVRPTGEGASAWLFLVFGSAICYALYQILTRRVAGVDRPETSVVYSALAGAVLLSLAAPFFWTAPAGVWPWLGLGSLGLFGGLGHYCVARALLWAPAAIVSPLHYMQLVWAAALGYLIFGDVPTAWTWVGALVIIGSGVAIAWQEARRG